MSREELRSSLIVCLRCLERGSSSFLEACQVTGVSSAVGGHQDSHMPLDGTVVVGWYPLDFAAATPDNEGVDNERVHSG